MDAVPQPVALQVDLDLVHVAQVVVDAILLALPDGPVHVEACVPREGHVRREPVRHHDRHRDLLLLRRRKLKRTTNNRRDARKQTLNEAPRRAVLPCIA